MKPELATSLQDQLTALFGRVQSEWRWPSPSVGFVYFAANAAGIDLPRGCSVTGLSPEHASRMDEAPVLAALGYLFTTNQTDITQAKQAWLRGLERLAGRSPFPADRESFVYRPFELLGVTLGILHHPNGSGHRSWLASVLQRAEQELCTYGVFNAVLGALSARLAGVLWKPVHLPTTSDLDPAELALVYWVAREWSDLFSTERPSLEAIGSEVIRRLALTNASDNDVARSFLLYACLHREISEMLTSSAAPKFSNPSGAVPEFVPSALMKALRSGQATVIVGAGVSRAAAGLPSWDATLQAALTFLRAKGVDTPALRTIDPLLEDGCYEEAGQVIQRLLDRINGKPDFFYQQFHIEIGAITDETIPVALWELSRGRLFTTNYDRVLEFTGPRGTETVTWQEPGKMLAALRHGPAVVHLHGVYNIPDSIIFSAGDYTRLAMAEAHRNFVRALWTNGPLLFIGASASGMGDLDFSRLFAWARQVVPESPFTSYCLQPKAALTAAAIQHLYRSYAIEVVEYGDSYAELGPFLTRLSGCLASPTST